MNKKTKNRNASKKKRIVSAVLAALMIISVLAGTFQSLAINASALLLVFMEPPTQSKIYKEDNKTYLHFANDRNNIFALSKYTQYDLNLQIDWKEGDKWQSDIENWENIETYKSKYDFYTYNIADSYGLALLDDNGIIFNKKDVLPEKIRLRYVVEGISEGEDKNEISNWSDEIDISLLETYNFNDNIELTKPILYEFEKLEDKNYVVKCKNEDVMKTWYGINSLSLVQYFEYKINDKDWASLSSCIVNNQTQTYELSIPDEFTDSDSLQIRSRYGLYNKESKVKVTSAWSDSVSSRGMSLDSKDYKPSDRNAEFLEPATDKKEESLEKTTIEQKESEKSIYDNKIFLIAVLIGGIITIILMTYFLTKAAKNNKEIKEMKKK